MSPRVGMIAPISYAYDPLGYGPWERVTHDLTERLVADGIDVTLFAPSGSETLARLVETVPGPLSEMVDADPRLFETEHLAVAMEAASSGALDIVHSHLHVHALPYGSLLPIPLLTTLHGAAWNTAHHRLLLRYRKLAFVSLSDRERVFLPELNYVATVGNGLDLARFPMGVGDGGYLAFVGRMAPEKAPDLAAAVARRAGVPLKIAGPIENRHREFFDDFMRGADDVEYLGPLEQHEVAELLGGAQALVMPLRWDEPFGLVVIESLAAGTPVIAWRRGAMPEIVDDGLTGFLVDDVETAARAVTAVPSLDRAACRQAAEERFSDARMARDYAGVYRSLTGHLR
ncbi:MAG TPA: glycosyltransferase family 4 protein [Acidimicrobiia bacterium]|nr:glycosyltransferase family 4 protein [Acidimicrobiia bacterium]